MNSDLPAVVIAALQQGRKIEAIKRLREERGIGLTEAKSAVEAYLRANPVLQQQLQLAQREAWRGALRWLAVIAIGAVAAYVLVSTG